MMFADLPPVNVQRAARLVLAAEAPVWQHNLPAARRFTITCTSPDRRVMLCVLRAYTKRVAGHRKLLLRLPMPVTVVHPHKPRIFEDGSGWVRYSANRTLSVDALDRIEGGGS